MLNKYESYCALGTVLHIVDRKLDLSLLSDHRVLKECYTAQEDRVTGPLQERVRRMKKVDASDSRKEGRAGKLWCTSIISV